MKDKRGFTLTELTLSIALIMILAVLVIPNLIDMGTNTKQELYDSKIELALAGAYKYGKKNIDSLSSECKDVTIGSLINLGHVTPDDESRLVLVNPFTNESMNNVIICVYYEDGRVKAKVKE